MSATRPQRPMFTLVELLSQYREQLDSPAAVLREHETLDRLDAYAAGGLENAPAGSPPGVTVPAPA